MIELQRLIDFCLVEIDLKWEDWKPMPKYITGKYQGFTEHAGTGVYQVVNDFTGEKVLFGTSINCKKRMKSLYGSGTRNNEEKKQHVVKNWRQLKWRIIKTDTIAEAEFIEAILKAGYDHIFNT